MMRGSKEDRVPGGSGASWWVVLDVAFDELQTER